MFRKILVGNIFHNIRTNSQKIAQPLKIKKPTAPGNTSQYFVDLKELRVLGGKGGDGCISFLTLFKNDHAGPDGGDGGHGGHVILEASYDVKDLKHVPTEAKAKDGEKGYNKDCHGRNAQHNVIKVPVGTIIRNAEGKVVGDLEQEGLMFVAARGGAGGKGNHFFANDYNQAPKIAEYGGKGEHLEYTIELRSMAHIGLIGFPNAGKSTLLRAISRARPKVADYPFTTLKPHLGMILYDDCQQIAVADLPGLIPDSHKNRGLGIQFLRHAERCMALLYVLDVSLPEPWEHLKVLQYELSKFSEELTRRPQLVLANKIDLPHVESNVKNLEKRIDLPVISISAKLGTNIMELLKQIRILCDNQKEAKENMDNT